MATFSETLSGNIYREKQRAVGGGSARDDTVLFEQKAAAIGNKSRFVILDFNGEYTAGQIAPPESKTVFQLSTRAVPAEGAEAPGSKFPLHEHEFWNSETLSLLFQATQNTQRPFLNRLIEGKRRFEANAGSLSVYAKAKFREAFCAGECKSGTLDLMRSVARILQHAPLAEILRGITWHAGQGRFRRGFPSFRARCRFVFVRFDRAIRRARATSAQ